MSVTELWRYQNGTDAPDRIRGAAALSDGSFVVGGRTGGSWGASDAGDSDLLAAKISSEGTSLWAWQDGTSGNDEITHVLALDDDSIVVAGYVYEIAASTDYDFVVYRLYSNGTTQWSWRDGTDEDDRLYTAAVTTDGNIVVAGYTNGSWNAPRLGYADIAAMKLHPNGTEIWRWQEGTGGTGDMRIWASAARPDGSVVFTGYTEGSWNDALSPESTKDFIAVALDEHGEVLWRWQNGTAGNSELRAATALADGSVVLAGFTAGDWIGSNQGARDFMAVKLDVDGAEEWRWQNGTIHSDSWEAAALGTDGSIILAGSVPENDSSSFAAISLDADGAQVLWTYQDGTSSMDSIAVATVRSDGAVLLAGTTTGSWDITDADDTTDFAAVLLTTSEATPTGIPSSAPSSTHAVFVTPTTLEPGTASPSLVPTTSEPVTIRSPNLNPTALPSATPSSGSSTRFSPAVIGAVVAVAVLLAVIAVCMLRRRKTMGTVGSRPRTEDEPACYQQAVTPTPKAMGAMGCHAPVENEPACYPQVVTPTPNAMETVGSHAPAEDERACYPQVVTPTPNAMETVGSHAPAEDEPACYPQAVTPIGRSPLP